MHEAIVPWIDRVTGRPEGEIPLAVVTGGGGRGCSLLLYRTFACNAPLGLAQRRLMSAAKRLRLCVEDHSTSRTSNVAAIYSSQYLLSFPNCRVGNDPNPGNAPE